MSNDVRRPKEFEQILYDLCQSDKRVFLSYKDALVFAACLGFETQTKTSFDKTSEQVGTHIFKGEFDDAVFQILSLCETGDPMMMSEASVSARIKIFEEYAAGGLEILKSRVYDGPEEWDSALSALISEFGETKSKILDDITGIVG